MKLTAENYYSKEADWAYFSGSQILDFMDCEGKALNSLHSEENGEMPSIAMLIGSYVDAYFTDDLEEFKAGHPEIFTRKGELRSSFIKANEIIARLEEDDLALRMLGGDHQQILTGKVFGEPFKGKLDCWLDAKECQKICDDFPEMTELMFAAGAIVDLKVVRNFDSMYREGFGRQNFIEYWRYDLKMAIYQELKRMEIGEKVPCYILAVTKEDSPNIGLFQLPQALMDANMEILKDRMPHFAGLKNGTEFPVGCGNCEWCRKTKKLTGATWLEEWA